MAKRKASKALDTWKKKRWFHIIATKLFNENVIGETAAEEPSTLVGRTITQNMMTVTGDIKRKDTEVTFRIIDFKDQRAVTEVVRYEILPSALKRRVRRARDRLDESFLAKTKDERLIRIKPFLLTINNTKSSIQKDLRRTLKKELLAYINSTPYETIVAEVVSHKIQRELNEKLKKIFPLKICEIRRIELAKESRKNKTIAVAEGEEKKAEGEEEDDIPIITAEDKEEDTAEVKEEDASPADKESPAQEETPKEKAEEEDAKDQAQAD